MEKKDEFGTVLRLTVEGMKYTIQEIIDQRHGELKKGIEEYVNGNEMIRDFMPEVDSAIRSSIRWIVIEQLKVVIKEYLKKDKELKLAIERYFGEKKEIIAKSICDSVIKELK